MCIQDQVDATQPSPEFVDNLAKRYLAAKVMCAEAQATLGEVEKEATALVQEWGIVVPKAEQSRRLSGKLAVLTVTKSNTLTVLDDRVDTLRDALFVNGYGAFFTKLFAERKKWEVVEGAEAALKAESLPKRLAEKVMNLWGRCIDVKAKKPSLKVQIADPAKPAKRAKKAGN